MLEPEGLYRPRHSLRLVSVKVRRPARLYRAEAARPRAGVAQYKESRRAVLPALGDVGAVCLFANGVQPRPAHKSLQVAIVLPLLPLDRQPGRFTLDLLRLGRDGTGGP